MKANKRIMAMLLSVLMALCLTTDALAVGDGLFSWFKDQDKVSLDRDEYDSLKRFSKLAEIMDIVETYYYQDTDSDKLLEYAIWGMLQGLDDPYTFYYNPKSWKEMWEDDEGSYAGVGIQMLADFEANIVTISRVFKNTPAEEAGLRKGDRLVRVDDLEVTAETMTDAANLMRGKEAETVEIEVVRRGEHIVFTVGRRQIHVNWVESTVLDGGVGLIVLYDFAGDCVEGFTEALKEVREAGAKSLIVDLRDNGGGWVDAAEKIGDLFLDKQLFFYSEDHSGHRSETYTTDGKDDIPMVVMINGGSASSSEILAGSLHASGRARLVGTQSYGKGIMQYVFPLSGVNGEEDGMQVTFAQYFLPNGQAVHKVGLTPDVTVEMPEELVGQYFALGDLSDPQLKTAYDEALALQDGAAVVNDAAALTSEPAKTDWSVGAGDLLPVSGIL